MTTLADVQTVLGQMSEPGIDLRLLLEEVDGMVGQIRDEEDRRMASRQMEELVMLIDVVEYEEPEE